MSSVGLLKQRGSVKLFMISVNLLYNSRQWVPWEQNVLSKSQEIAVVALEPGRGTKKTVGLHKNQ